MRRRCRPSSWHSRSSPSASSTAWASARWSGAARNRMASDGLEARLAQPAPIPLDAELGCRPGELLALVGPSGAGKTTILRAIAGIIRPREGLIACNGEVWFDAARNLSLPPQRRRVGLVFQD